MYGIRVNIETQYAYNRMNLKMLQVATVETAVHRLCLFYTFHLPIRKSPVITATLKYCRFFSVATVHIEFNLPSVPGKTFSLLAHPLLYKLFTVKTTTSWVHRA